MEEIRRKLKIYGALDNDDRLNIIIALYNNPDISFNELARSVNIDKPLLAYHVGLLRHVGLIESKYERVGRKSTKYRLTDQAIKVLEELEIIEKPAKLP